MTKHKSLTLSMAVALAVMLAIPAVALAWDPPTSPEFDARVTAKNKDLYSFSIDYDHINYYSNAYGNGSSLPLLSMEHWQTGCSDHEILVTNTGAKPFYILMQASSEPTATDGIDDYTVPLAASWNDYYSEGRYVPNGSGEGKGAWHWGCRDVSAGYGDGAITVVSTYDVSEVGYVGVGGQKSLFSEFSPPQHWPNDNSLDYNWAGTIIAAPSE